MRSLLRGCLASVLALLMVIIFFITGFLTHAYRSGALVWNPGANPASSSTSISKPPANFEIFYETLGVLQENFYGDLPQDNRLQYAAIRGVLSKLEDSHTILVEPEPHQREKEQLRGEFGGIGAQLSTNEEGEIVVVAPIADTPAAQAGLLANDVILEVDGTVVTGMPLNEVVTLIRGPVDTEVKLLIQRPGVAESFELSLKRAIIPEPRVFHRMIEGSDIGYIQMTFFSDRAPRELRGAIEQLRAEGAEKLILDLRNNPGGLLDAAINSASLFIGDGVIAYQQYKDGSRQPHEAKGAPISTDEPLVVLINEGSASASEILAGALQAYGRATLVGTKSYGKGTVQIPYSLSDGSSLHVTIAHWLTPSEVNLSTEGLTPEILIEEETASTAEGEDPFIQRAIQLLEEME